MSEKKRDLGIDLLRMVSMFMVTVLHTLTRGGILMNLAAGTVTYHTMWLMEYAAFCAVNCFALISGYVGFDAKHRPQNAILMWLQVAFYTVGITAGAWILRPDIIQKSHLLNAILPVTRNQYWYFTGYFPIFFMMPLFDAAVRTLPQKIMRRALLVVYALFAFSTFFGAGDVYHLSGGYSLLWLAYLYVLGAYFRKYDSFSRFRRPVWIGVYIVAVLLAESRAVFGQKNIHALPSYAAPSIMLSGIALLFLFRNLPCKRFEKPIKFICPTAFAVYLIHTHPLVWDYVLRDRFLFCLEYPLILKIVAVPTIALGIYIICTLIELLRIQLFRLLHIKAAVNRIFSVLHLDDA